MPRNFVSADDHVFEQAAYLAYTSSGETNLSERAIMRGILRKAIKNELTDNQRICLVEYYVRGRKMKDIASMLSLNPSTVTRHIRAARDKLRHIASYY